MEIVERKTVDMLTKDSVSILTQKFVMLDGVETKVGENHRRSYFNSENGRYDLTNNEPEEAVNAVMAIWGSFATIQDD